MDGIAFWVLSNSIFRQGYLIIYEIFKYIELSKTASNCLNYIN